MFNVYYAKEGTEFYFLNKLEDDVWVNVLETECDVAVNGDSEANVVLLYKTYSINWGGETIASNVGVYVFISLMNHTMFAIKADNMTKREFEDYNEYEQLHSV